MIKGFNVPGGYFGWVNDCWMYFSCEQDYLEYVKEAA